MKKVQLEVREDQEMGELGLMVVGTPVINYPMVAREGLLVAHDLLEHVNGVECIGSIGDELEALGGVWYVRGQHGDIRRGGVTMHTPEENLAADVANMARIHNYGTPLRVPVPNNRAGDQEDSFREIVAIGIKEARQEFDGEPYDRERLINYTDASLHLIRAGYRKARRKYERYGRWYANSLFWSIAEAVDNVISHIDYEGQTFELLIRDRFDVRCYETYPEEDY